MFLSSDKKKSEFQKKLENKRNASLKTFEAMVETNTQFGVDIASGENDVILSVVRPSRDAIDKYFDVDTVKAMSAVNAKSPSSELYKAWLYKLQPFSLFLFYSLLAAAFSWIVVSTGLSPKENQIYWATGFGLGLVVSHFLSIFTRYDNALDNLDWLIPIMMSKAKDVVLVGEKNIYLPANYGLKNKPQENTGWRIVPYTMIDHIEKIAFNGELPTSDEFKKYVNVYDKYGNKLFSVDKDNIVNLSFGHSAIAEIEKKVYKSAT